MREANTIQETVAATPEGKLLTLRKRIGALDRVAVAFSGGVDSTFVLRVALDVLGPGNVLAVTGRSPSLKSSELDEAVRLAAELGAEHVLLNTGEFEKADYLANPVNRCYFCKTTLYETMRPLLAERGISVILNGTNADDLGDYRPGLTAAAEHNVVAPAAEAGLTKADVRELSRRLGLPTHDKPAAPCLSSRVQYGETITPEKLRAIEQAEAFLVELGFRECRVRHHDRLARIEVPPAEFSRLVEPSLARRVDERLRSLGYAYVTFDLRGLRSGSMNEVIPLGLPRS
ncbi:MAG: ATP-dependent sacrificial sulfur transferase LarE [Phycisphaerales bacterium]|nr:ATP-dependent sacrificial sulfur transferase LarE [Phycisphaerales bacterium]